MEDHISVCICTFRRNEALTYLLTKLSMQETRGLFNISIVVVDNDQTGQARNTVAALQSKLKMEIEYAIEIEQSIPAARNLALRMARGNYIAIIDDDEFPPNNWLVTLYLSIQLFDSDGALGPVYPFFMHQPPSWLIKGQFCERPVYRTGTWLRWNQTRTGNVLFKKNILEEHAISFDVKWRTSGSDQAFFKRAMEFGYKFIAVKEAPVYETVSPDRCTKKYYIKRAIVQGFNAHKYRAGDIRGISRLSEPLRSSFALIIYSLTLPFYAFLGIHLFIKYLAKASYFLSRLLAVFGIELIKKRNF